MRKNKPMSRRGRERVMLAASQVNTADNREAAILGGIVRCACDTSHFDARYVQHYVPQAVNWSNKGERTPTDASVPTLDEIADVLRRFSAIYDPPDDSVPVAA